MQQQLPLGVVPAIHAWLKLHSRNNNHTRAGGRNTSASAHFGERVRSCSGGANRPVPVRLTMSRPRNPNFLRGSLPTYA